MVKPCCRFWAMAMAAGARNAGPPPLSTRSSFIFKALQVPAGRADYAELPVFHQSYRDPFQEGAHTPLVQEASHEAALHQEIAHARQDAAGEVDAAAGAVEQRQVAGEAAEQGAEHLEGL